MRTKDRVLRGDEVKRRKPEPIWTAVLGKCIAAGYDFKSLNKNMKKETPEYKIIYYPFQMEKIDG